MRTFKDIRSTWQTTKSPLLAPNSARGGATVKRNTPEQHRAIANLMARLALFQKSDQRHAKNYPKFVPGMTTADYLDRFEFSHGDRMLSIHMPARFKQPAPMLDPSFPECVEEIDA